MAKRQRAVQILIEMRDDQRPFDRNAMHRSLFLPPSVRETVIDFIAEVTSSLTHVTVYGAQLPGVRACHTILV